MSVEHEAWLKLIPEEPLEPELPICDPHHHQWDRPDDRYFVEDFLRDAAGNNVVQTVCIECGAMYRKDGPREMKPVGEIEFLQNLTGKLPGKTKIGAGYVGFADLTLGSGVVPVLEAEIAAAKGRFRGIRHIVTWDASPDIRSSAKFKGLAYDPKFREGFACLKRYNLTFDSWQYFTQLQDIADLARAFPDTTIVVDHLGGVVGAGPYAGKKDEVFQKWKKGMKDLAACPNTVLKVGGLGMPRTGFGWDTQPKPPSSAQLAKDSAPYIDPCIEMFGVKRCMFESNFPPDKASFSYTACWNSFKLLTKGYSKSEKAALFHDTAVRVYRLA
ncbi:MAG: amidohydrolase family protein [Dehalococcoidales bacterium]|nr:amidohydrolase family protein [Dehalococcoidales bacterium]